MKTLFTVLTLVTGLAVLTPGTAQAGHSHGSRNSVSHACSSCGGSIYRQRVIVGYNHCGDPIYGWRTVSHRCTPRHIGGGHSSHGHGRSHHHGH